ncbi:MAG TPA: helix-turn-helix domain-containing protein [Sphingomicrobium sp.]|jgi:DNA-binding HxlR family transcriptional regulator
MQWRELENQDCSIARTMAVIGDRWTLMILRECFLRVRRFDDFQTHLGIGRAILADRLSLLIAHDVLAKVQYQSHPPRYDYRLTNKGRDLHPILMAIVHWGDTHMTGPAGRPVLHEHHVCGRTFDPVMTCSECGEALAASTVSVRPGPGRTRRDQPVTDEDVDPHHGSAG